MKKIYLLTFHGSVNYGAVLQATALYKTICSLGVECIVLDYNRKIHHKNFIKISGKNIKGKLYQLVENLIVFLKLKWNFQNHTMVLVH